MNNMKPHLLYFRALSQFKSIVSVVLIELRITQAWVIKWKEFSYLGSSKDWNRNLAYPKREAYLHTRVQRYSRNRNRNRGSLAKKDGTGTEILGTENLEPEPVPKFWEPYTGTENFGIFRD